MEECICEDKVRLFYAIKCNKFYCNLTLFIYLRFYVAFNTVQVISRWVVGRAEETSTYSSLGFCTVNCRPTASNYQLSHLRACRESNPGLRGGRRECYHSATVAPCNLTVHKLNTCTYLILTKTDPPYLPSQVYFTGDQKLNENLSINFSQQ